MISVTIRRNKKGRIGGYTVRDHGETDVCAAVSLLTLNTANSIEAFTDEVFNCDYDPEGGFFQLELPRVIEGHDCPEVDLLLEAMVLGLKSVKEDYGDEIVFKDEDDKND
ncbi:MAG: ribosomal-processing cysteine protease Prp [Defluviitaleaceae bacterium]|nr:ribosomal-processing cysteine protease Prp [Defluviitaleaceae bacterium]